MYTNTCMYNYMKLTCTCTGNTCASLAYLVALSALETRRNRNH